MSTHIGVGRGGRFTKRPYTITYRYTKPCPCGKPVVRQDERIKDMANQIAENEDKRVETERKLARLQERHAALKERVDTGFDILQRRLDSNIERFRADTSSTITEVRLILKDPPEDETDLPDGRSAQSPDGS